MAQKLFDLGTITFTKKALRLCNVHGLNPMDFVRKHEANAEEQRDRFIIESKFVVGDSLLFVTTTRLEAVTQVSVLGTGL